MKKTLILVLTVVLAAGLVGSAFAVPAGKMVDYAGAAAGKVVFDGKKHADAGNKCNDCHPSLFQMKKGAAQLMMKDMNAGKSCGACHNGTKAFKVSECAKCHVK